MDAGQLHRLARVLREIALTATADPGDAAVSANVVAIAEDIARHPGTSIGEIARRTRVAQSQVSTTVSAMSDQGFVALSPDPADRRRVQVRIDTAARSQVLRARGRRPITDALAAVGAEDGTKRTPAQLRRIERLLDELAAALDV